MTTGTADRSPTRHPVSALALGPRGWLQTANFTVCGAAVTTGAWGITVSAGQPLLGVPLPIIAAIASFVMPGVVWTVVSAAAGVFAHFGLVS
ncbi:MAG: DUF998 domain-containing protein [Nesterenkonia sp.]